jgi:hypothetical protein
VGKTGDRTGFFTTDDDAIVRYELQGSDANGWEIKQTGSLSMPAWANPDKDDHLVGITALDDGTIVVGSKNGVLMAVLVTADGQFQFVDALPLAKHIQTDNAHVSNSISSDGQAVYVVTQREMLRADFNPHTRKFGFRWGQIYGPEAEWYVGRLGPGAGSTPSVTSCHGRQLVTITDGALPMNILWYDAETGEVVGSRKVQFGADENGNEPTTSEQSVAVDGCKSFVVQNYMGKDRLSPDTQCTSAQPGSFRHARLTEFCANLMASANTTDLFISKACPPAMGCMSLGAAVYEVQPYNKGQDGAYTHIQHAATSLGARMRCGERGVLHVSLCCDDTQAAAPCAATGPVPT